MRCERIPLYAMTDNFDKDFGVDQWRGHNVFFRDGDKEFRTYLINGRGDEAHADRLELSRHHAARLSGDLGGLARGLPPKSSPYEWWNGTTSTKSRPPRPARSGSI